MITSEHALLSRDSIQFWDFPSQDSQSPKKGTEKSCGMFGFWRLEGNLVSTDFCQSDRQLHCIAGKVFFITYELQMRNLWGFLPFKSAICRQLKGCCPRSFGVRTSGMHWPKEEAEGPYLQGHWRWGHNSQGFRKLTWFLPEIPHRPIQSQCAV